MRKRFLLGTVVVVLVACGALVGASTGGATPSSTTVNVWLGLKNSDDVGTSFDLKAQVWEESYSLGTGYAWDVSGGSSGFNNAHLVTIPIPSYVGVSGVSVEVWVRVACASHHTSGTARLWWNDSAANSNVTESPGFGTLYFVGGGSGVGPRTGALSSSVGPGPKQTSDVFVKKSGCPDQADNWQPFGTWSQSET